MSVSVQLRLPRFVAAIELPSTRGGSVRLPGAVTLSTPAWVVPVTVCVPLAVAAKAWLDPTAIREPAMAMPIISLAGRLAGVGIDAFSNIAFGVS